MTEDDISQLSVSSGDKRVKIAQILKAAGIPANEIETLLKAATPGNTAQIEKKLKEVSTMGNEEVDRIFDAMHLRAGKTRDNEIRFLLKILELDYIKSLYSPFLQNPGLST
jgi:DNA-binding transcriptional MerR regulator